MTVPSHVLDGVINKLMLYKTKNELLPKVDPLMYVSKWSGILEKSKEIAERKH